VITASGLKRLPSAALMCEPSAPPVCPGAGDLPEHGTRHTQRVRRVVEAHIGDDKRRCGGHSNRNSRIFRDYLAGKRVKLLSRRYDLSERQVLSIIKLPAK